jgi:hypothetical protein
MLFSILSYIFNKYIEFYYIYFLIFNFQFCNMLNLMSNFISKIFKVAELKLKLEPGDLDNKGGEFYYIFF